MVIDLRPRPTRQTRVYLSAPLSNGDQEANVHRAIDAATALHDAGFLVFVPHLSWYWAKRAPHITYNEWLEQDREWLATCDLVLRLHGESYGAAIEESWARAWRIPVYVSLKELIDHEPNRRTA